jgi:hypothetical protein
MANRGNYDFTWTPTWVTPRAPVYAVLITPSESFKKDRQLLDTNAINIYDLEFDGVSDANRNLILNHFSGVTGEYDSFWWSTVPSYLNIGSGATVNYVPGSYKEEVESRYWQIRLAFEVVV